mgnify:FL=1|nr:MAG TPA: PLxRFG domain protein [Caudoviricetes sp.]
MAVRFNNYQPGAQLAAALDQADRQYQDKLALGWVPSERDPDQGIFGSFWDSLTSSAESTLGGALTAAGVVSDSPWLAGVGGDLTRQAARYSDWANDYDDNPDKSRWSLGYFLDPHGLYSDAGTMLGSSAPGMLAGAALAAGGGAVLPALAVLGSAGLEVGANFGQSYMDAKRDNIEAQIKAGQRPAGTVYDGDIDQAAWDSFTGDPYKNAELIGSSFMDTALDVATGATGGLFSLAGKGLAKAGIADALASNGGKVAGAVLGDAARADTLLGRAAYGLSTASKPIDFIGNRVANAFGEGFQEAWQQRVQDAMANKFDDNRADAGSFFRDIANGDWNNFTDDEINSFNSAFLPTLVSGVGVAGARNVGRYMYNNIDSLGPTVEAKRDYNDLMQTTGIANALADSTDLSDYIGHYITPEALAPAQEAVTDNSMSLAGDFVQPEYTNDSEQQVKEALPYAPEYISKATEPLQQYNVAPSTQNIDANIDTRTAPMEDPMSKVVDSTRARMADLPDILTRAYNNADIDAINKNISEGDTKLSPELLNKAVQGDTNAAYYILSNLDRKNVVQAIRERNNERKAQAKQAKQELDATKNDIKNVIKGVGKKDVGTEAVQKAQDIIHSLAPNGKAEELADKIKSRFLKVNQPLLDRANNGDTKAIRDVLRAVDPNAYMAVQNQQKAMQGQASVEDVADVPVERPVVEETQQTAQEPQEQVQPEQKPVETRQEAVSQQKAEQPQTPVQTESLNTSPLGGIARPQETQVAPTQTEQTTQQVQQQPAQNAQNAAKQGYSTAESNVTGNKGAVTLPKQESVNTPENTVNNTQRQSAPSDHPDSKANVIANANTTEGLHRARKILAKFRSAKHVKVDKDTAAKIASKDENVSRPVITKLLQDIDDDTYNRIMRIPKGEKNENTQTSENPEGSTDNKTETRAETGGNTHQQGRLNDDGTSSKTEGSEARAEQTVSKEVKQEEKRKDNKEEAKPRKLQSKEKKTKEEEESPLYKDDGGNEDEDTQNEIVNYDDDIESGLEELHTSMAALSKTLRNHNKAEAQVVETDNNDNGTLTHHFISQESKDEKANKKFNAYRNGKLKRDMQSFVSKYYATMNKMSFANLISMLPDARTYISYLGGAHKFATKEEEFRAKMHYTALFGSLASFGINVLRNRMSVATGANRNGIVDFDNPESFAQGYADLLDIIPGAIHTAIATYDGVRKSMESSAGQGKAQNVASLNTWFYYVLEHNYQQYIRHRADSGLILPKFDSKQLYSVVGDLLPGANAKTREERRAALDAIQWMGLLHTPKELHEYGINTLDDVLSWLLPDNRAPQLGIKTTGRMELVLAINNAMVRGPYADKLRELLPEAEKTGDYIGEYGRTFMEAFKTAFLSVVNTPEGRAALDTYQTMQHLDSAEQKIIIDAVSKVSPEIKEKANEYGKTFITKMAFESQKDITGHTIRLRDIEVDEYIKATMSKLEDMIRNNTSLTKEGKAVAISKANILLQALELAEVAKDKHIKPTTDAEKEKAEKERAAKLKYRQEQKAKKDVLEGDDENDFGDHSRDMTGGGLTEQRKTAASINYDFGNNINLQNERSVDYFQAAVAARYLSIISFELQLCNELNNSYDKQMLKQKNQDGAFISSTEKANLMIAFITKTVLDNYGDVAESEFAQHKKDSDADEVRAYAQSLIQKINRIFPTAKTKLAGQEFWDVNMKNFNASLDKICQEVQSNPIGKKLFGLSYSKNIISKMRVESQEVNKLVTRRTSKFPWLNTKTTTEMMPAEIFDKSKFVAQFINDNKFNFDEISISDMLPIVSRDNKRKQVDAETFTHNMKALGYDEHVAEGLNQFTDKWINNLWEKCSEELLAKLKKGKVTQEKYDAAKYEFTNRWGNAINKAKRNVLAAAMAGTGHSYPTDSDAALRLGFALDRKVTKVDAVLFSKALEAKIQSIANKMATEHNVYTERAVQEHRSTRINPLIYKYINGEKRGKIAAELKDKRVVSYDGRRYVLTPEQYKQFKEDADKLDQFCQPENMVSIAPREATTVDALADPSVMNSRRTDPYAIKQGSDVNNPTYSTNTGENGVTYLVSSGTVVGAIDTLADDYFKKDASGIPNNVIVKALMVLDTGLPKEVIMNNGIEEYIKQVARRRKKKQAIIRKQIMDRIEAAVNKFMTQEQLEIAAQSRNEVQKKLKDKGLKEGPSALRDTINKISLGVKNQKGKFVYVRNAPKLNYGDKQIEESKYTNSWVYNDLRKAIFGAIGLMDFQEDGYKVKPLTITDSSPIKKVKAGSIDIHNTDSTKWTTKDKVNITENPIANLLQFLGSIDKKDLREEYGKDIPFTIDDLMEDPHYNYLMMAHNDKLMGSDGLITSLHTFSYRLAQKDALTYNDIANLCSLITIASQRLNGFDKIRTLADQLNRALHGVHTAPEVFESVQTNNRVAFRMRYHSQNYVGTQLHKLQPRSTEELANLQSQNEETLAKTKFEVSKENKAFLGTEFATPLKGEPDNVFAHQLFVNVASKVLGVIPYISNKLSDNSGYTDSTGRLTSLAQRSTVYHELMHAFTDQAVAVDVAEGRYKLATKSDTYRDYDSFGGLRVSENVPDVPRKERGVAEKVIRDAISNELTSAFETLNKSDSLLARQILAITDLVDVSKLIPTTAKIWAQSNLIGYDETKTGRDRYILKLGAKSLGLFYDSSDKGDYEALVMNMMLPSIIFGTKVIDHKLPLLFQIKQLVTETYSHLDTVPEELTNGGNIAESETSNFMASWLYESTNLLHALQSRDPAFKIRNKDKARMRNELFNAARGSIQELTAMDNTTIIHHMIGQKNQHAAVEQKKKAKQKKNVGTGKGAITTVRDVSQDAGSPQGWFMQLLYTIANKRNKTFTQTSPSKLNHAKDIKLAWKPGMRWLEDLVKKPDADRLFDESQRAIAWQQELNAKSDAYIKQLKQLLTIDGDKLQTKALRQYFDTEINVNSDRGRDLVELFDLPYEAGKDERCKNRSASGKNAMLKVYADDVFFVLHSQPDKATAMATMNDKIDKMKTYYKKKDRNFYKNQAFWYREDTGTLVFYACPDTRMKDGKFKNLFIAYPSNEDGTGVKGRANMKVRLQKQVLKECERFRRKAMKDAGYAQPIIDRFIASQALYRALLMNAYSREQKRAMQNDDIINRTETGFLHAYAPRYYSRYILQKEVWNEIDEEQVNPKSVKAGFIIQKDGKYYHVITYSIGSFESKRDRARYRNEHPIGKNERYVEKTRDEWLQEQGGGRTDIVGNVDTSIGVLTDEDIERGKNRATDDIPDRLAQFIRKKFNASEKWEGEDSIEKIIDALRNMDEQDEEEFGKYKPRLIRTAKMIRVSKNKVQTFRQVSDALKASGAQYLAANYSRERTSDNGLYSHDVIGSLKHYLHTVNSVEALTPFYRDMTQTIYKYTGRNYDRTKRDSYYSPYNIMCELVDNMNGRDKPVDGFMRRLSVMVVDAIYAVPGMRNILNACGVYLPDMWLPALLHNSIAVNVYLKLGMFNVSTALAQYAQLANVYALGGESAFAYAMKKMPGILAKAHKPSDILKNEFDVSAYGKEIQQVMADLYLTKQGKSLFEQEGENAFQEALKRGDKSAIELQAFDEMYGTLTGKDSEIAINDMAAQLGNAGSAYEGDSVIDLLPKTGKNILNLGMGGFRGADLSCRLFAALVAQHLLDTSPKYKKFRESKAELGEEEYNMQRMLMIRDFVYRTNFNFNRATDPLLLAKGGQLAKCVFQFASYGFQTFDFMNWMLKNKKSTELKRFLGTMMLFSGVISGIPMMTMISGMAQAITGTNPEDWIKAFIMKAAGNRKDSVSHAIGEALCYGIAAPVFGVDISKKVGLADIMKDPTDLRNLGGPSLGTAIDFSSAAGASYDAILYDKYTTDQLMFAWLKAVPAASRWLQAARGQYYSYSKLMPKSEYQSMSNADRAKNLMGFNPIENKLNTDINRYITDENQEYSNKTKDAMVAYVNNPTEANLKKLQDYGKTPEQAHKTVDKYIKPKITAEQAEKMVTKAKAPEAEIVRSNVRALSGLLN